VTALPPAGTPYGARVRDRLTSETAVWLTTVGRDGTPQPNPVWFLWDGDESLLVYNRADANRLAHLRHSPRLAVHLNSNDHGGDIVVLTCTAAVDESVAPPHENAAYRAKYEASMIRVSGSPEEFSEQYPVPLRITIEKVRGF
jgi:PPOX class probable F420-dependent enzyme